MEQPVYYKHKIDFLISDNTPSIQPTQNSQNIYKKCNECNRKRKIFDKSHEICHVCYNIKTILKPKQSGNKVVDDFIRYTQSNYAFIEDGKMELIPYDQFTNIEFIAEGGFSKIYKATWVDGPINNWNRIKDDYWNITRRKNYTVVLKKLNNSKNITPKELNEIYSDKNAHKSYISDLIHYISNEFYNINWGTKLNKLCYIAIGLNNIHKAKIVHRDLHSGNIFFDGHTAHIGDLGISKSAIECTEDSNENYGIIPYMAPVIFQGQKYTEASDIYSYGMIMSSRSQSIDPFYYYQKNSKASSADKRKVDKGSVEDSNINDQSIKRRKLFENENYDYLTKEIELDINANMSQQQHNEYVTKEFDIDINNIDESNL
ncbi:kinase-like domain-containing protein [Rhizophagus irregularis DAOM 181602=DAOM 197198]|nr:kinase-like domain-containing protein [Rhizophagus irregularis DAOM 181602=DAOM 197198]